MELAGANPCVGQAALVCGFPHAGQVSLEVFDPRGRRIAVPFSGSVDAGMSTIVWDLRSDAGRSVAGGAYFARLAYGDESRVARIIVAR